MQRTELAPPRRRPLSGSRRGFSLVELMVVIVIIGMIGGIATVSWESLLPSQGFNTAVRKLSDVLNGARSDAIARNREFRIYYNLDDQSYRVRTPYRPGGGFAAGDEDDNYLWVDEEFLEDAGIEILEITVDDETYVDGLVYVRFDPLGAAAYHTIVLRQVLFDRISTIELLPLTGEIRFHDGQFRREPADESDFD